MSKSIFLLLPHHISFQRLYSLRPPFFYCWLFQKAVWEIPNNEKKVFLTFDDGPVPDVTPFVLNVLNKYNIKATFFCIGENIEKHPDIYQQIISEGHQIGNHTFNHLKGWKTNTEEYYNNIEKCEKLMPQNECKLFRPPYGKMTYGQYKQIMQKGYQPVMWSLLSGDFDTKISGEQCANNVIKRVKSGDIIVFHDSVKAYPRLKTALPKILEFLNQQGYQTALLP